MSIAKSLFELQAIEQAILAHNRELEDINSRISRNAAYEQARSALDEAQAGRSELEKQYKELDAEAEQVRGNIQQINVKLYGGKINNPKELMGFEQEAEMLKGQLGKKDDVLLDLMEKIDNGKSAIKKLQETLKQAEDAWGKEKQELGVQAGKLKEELKELEGKRQEALAAVDREAMALYEGIKGRKGQAVVRVEQGRCLGCRVTLSISELQRVRGNAIVTCSNCGRILYLS